MRDLSKRRETSAGAEAAGAAMPTSSWDGTLCKFGPASSVCVQPSRVRVADVQVAKLEPAGGGEYDAKLDNVSTS